MDRQTDRQTDKQTNMTDYPIDAEGAYNKQTNKPTKQKDYTSPALAGAGDYNKPNKKSSHCEPMTITWST